MTGKPMNAGAPEIEVTLAMIEAGTEILWKSGAVEHPLIDVDRDLIREIYLAMAACRSSPPQD
jgi:hypothetical protein